MIKRVLQYNLEVEKDRRNIVNLRLRSLFHICWKRRDVYNSDEMIVITGFVPMCWGGFRKYTISYGQPMEVKLVT